MFRRTDAKHLLILVRLAYTWLRQQVDRQLRWQLQTPALYAPLWPFRRHVEEGYKQFVSLAAVSDHLMRWKN